VLESARVRACVRACVRAYDLSAFASVDWHMRKAITELDYYIFCITTNINDNFHNFDDRFNQGKPPHALNLDDDNDELRF
jgi:hypothetical protein